MRKSKKIIFCIIMLFIVVAVGLFGFPTVTTDDAPPDYPDSIHTEVNADNTGTNTSASEEGKNSEEDCEPSSGQSREDEKTESGINDIIAGMTIEEKVGQIFFIKNDGRFDKTVLEEYPVGGIILFAGDFKFKSPESITAEIAAFQDKSRYPLLIGTDEEGGSVIRVSRYSTLVEEPFASPRSLYELGGYDIIEEDTRYKSRLLLSYGINVNFAPVCDVSFNPDEFMYPRSFGNSVSETSEYVKLVVNVMNEENIGSVLKHFPGYGDNGDTHKSIIRDKRGYEQFETVDFLPFEAGIRAGAECILVSHNIVECMDEEWPASLSYNVHDILRDELGFDGVIITDDLMMDGVSTYVSDEESAVRAVLAGNDMILSTDYQVQYKAVLDAVNSGTITEERLNQSIRRIMRWKYSLGIIK